ncbi:3' exoribonuclease family protein [Arthroderma uncinatum]|uniref:3' exoribonuclease family protein n=1 Tax=Arthroderma uncinatum TaxID=74035 RepID=UPI00144A830E|nr:3' exoribonuclease family protein [Arthroderma uncinatum]KAF3482248.1 3' exoribonuclease family protein [Arthroderma uncinatum]
MTDRRRINGPAGGTRAPVFVSCSDPGDKSQSTAFERPPRTRTARELRKIYLKTGVVPSASGSAYFELHPSNASAGKSLIPPSSSLKLICSVNGPKPLPRSTPFSPNLLLSAHVKFAPFAARRRRAHIRDMNERDLGVHLENALRGAIIGDRWPKSGLDITIMILEGEDDRWWGDMLTAESLTGSDGWGMMNVLAHCVTVASAAIADARIDCLDLVAGGVAAIVEDSGSNEEAKTSTQTLVLDPDPSEHLNISSACVVGYMPSLDEITELWLKGDLPGTGSNGLNASLGHDALMDGAIAAAKASHTVLIEAVKESAEQAANQSTKIPHNDNKSEMEM